MLEEKHTQDFFFQCNLSKTLYCTGENQTKTVKINLKVDFNSVCLIQKRLKYKSVICGEDQRDVGHFLLNSSSWRQTTLPKPLYIMSDEAGKTKLEAKTPAALYRNNNP